ncbi:hypothetical protein X975_17280, partial [Stegodyphus mimosarum]
MILQIRSIKKDDLTADLALILVQHIPSNQLEIFHISAAHTMLPL